MLKLWRWFLTQLVRFFIHRLKWSSHAVWDIFQGSRKVMRLSKKKMWLSCNSQGKGNSKNIAGRERERERAESDWSGKGKSLALFTQCSITAGYIVLAICPRKCFFVETTLVKNSTRVFINDVASISLVFMFFVLEHHYMNKSTNFCAKTVTK